MSRIHGARPMLANDWSRPTRTFFNRSNRSIPANSSCLESPPTPHPGTSVLSVHPPRCIRARRDTDYDDLRPPLAASSLARHVSPQKREHGPHAAAHHSTLPHNGSRGNQLGLGYQKQRGTVDSTAASEEGEEDEANEANEANEDIQTATVRALGMIFPT